MRGMVGEMPSQEEIRKEMDKIRKEVNKDLADKQRTFHLRKAAGLVTLIVCIALLLLLFTSELFWDIINKDNPVERTYLIDNCYTDANFRCETQYNGDETSIFFTMGRSKLINVSTPACSHISLEGNRAIAYNCDFSALYNKKIIYVQYENIETSLEFNEEARIVRHFEVTGFKKIISKVTKTVNDLMFPEDQ